MPWRGFTSSAEGIDRSPRQQVDHAKVARSVTKISRERLDSGRIGLRSGRALAYRRPRVGTKAVVREIDELLTDLSERQSRKEIIARLRYETEAADSSARRMRRRGGDQAPKSEARRDLAQRIERILDFFDSRLPDVSPRQGGPSPVRASSREAQSTRPVVRPPKLRDANARRSRTVNMV